MPRNDDAIDWSLRMMRRSDDAVEQRYAFALTNLTKAEVARMVTLMAALQAQRGHNAEG